MSNWLGCKIPSSAPGAHEFREPLIQPLQRAKLQVTPHTEWLWNFNQLCYSSVLHCEIFRAIFLTPTSLQSLSFQLSHMLSCRSALCLPKFGWHFSSAVISSSIVFGSIGLSFFLFFILSVSLQETMRIEDYVQFKIEFPVHKN